MKKLLAMLLVAVMSVSLIACGGETGSNETQTKESDSKQEDKTDGNKTEKFDLYQGWKNVLTGASFTKVESANVYIKISTSR